MTKGVLFVYVPFPETFVVKNTFCLSIIVKRLSEDFSIKSIKELAIDIDVPHF